MSIRTLLNQFDLPPSVVIEGKQYRPTDLTSKKVVYWLIANLGFANGRHPAYFSARRSLERMLGINGQGRTTRR